MKKYIAIISTLTILAVTGCNNSSTVDDAIRACGEGNVASVDNREGDFHCKEKWPYGLAE